MPDDRPKYCPRCGSEAPAHGAHCPECGADIVAEAYGEEASAVPLDPEAHEPDEDVPPEVERAREEHADDSGGWLWSFNRIALMAAVVVVMLVLGTGALVWLFSAGGAEHQLTDDLEMERDSGSTSTTVDVSGTLPEGRYATLMLGPSRAAEFEFSGSASAPIDVMVLPRDEYDEHYRERSEDLQGYSGLTDMDSRRVSGSGTLNAGDYVLVIDNTRVYGASPDGDVDVDITVKASV